MKIGINGLPRSGTKILQHNFQSYLKVQGPVLAPDCLDGIKEPFNFSLQENSIQFTDQGIVQLSPTELVMGKKYKIGIPLNLEIQQRFKFLYSREESWVFKRTPFKEFDPILYESAALLDKCVAITREDIFNHCLSYTLAYHLDIWHASEVLDQAIKTYTSEKIILDPKAFERNYNWFLDYNNIKWVSDIQVVKFEDMIKISSSKEFCDFFELPQVDFNFSPFIIEYGNNKLNMISNLDELKAVEKQVKSRQ